MTFASNLSRGLTLGALAMGLTLSSVNAQNGTNFHVLSNGLDVIYGGLGAGGAQTKGDGIGTWVAGEDCRGSHLTVLGDFGYRNSRFREMSCPLNNPSVGTLGIKWGGLYFFEIDGLNANNQAIFLNPSCPKPGPSFPLGTSGFINYGVGPGSSFSFALLNLGAGIGPVPSADIIVPNNGLVPSSSGGTITLTGFASNVNIGINSSGFCWGVQFTWIPSAVPYLDDIDGIWHYAITSPDNNQYWGFSNDEMNIWQSNTIVSDGGVSAFFQLTPNLDYDMFLTTVEPNTNATLAPRGINLTGPYYAQVDNVWNENMGIVNPNGGFDVGRGSSAISFSGTAGVANPGTGLGNQNVNNNPGTVSTLGFATWDNGGDHNGSVRLTWMTIDIPGALRQNPAAAPQLTKFGGQIRLPLPTATGFPTPLTNLCWTLFGHVTSVPALGPWPDVDGFGGTAPFGVEAIAGASWQFPTGNQPAACTGTKVNITYGTSGRLGVKGAAGGLTFDPSIADTSGTKEIYLFN